MFAKAGGTDPRAKHSVEITNSYDVKVRYDESDQVKQDVFYCLMRYFIKYNAFCGETIMQCDGPSLAATEVLCEIIDIIKFKTESEK